MLSKESPVKSASCTVRARALARSLARRSLAEYGSSDATGRARRSVRSAITSPDEAYRPRGVPSRVPQGRWRLRPCRNDSSRVVTAVEPASASRMAFWHNEDSVTCFAASDLFFTKTHPRKAHPRGLRRRRAMLFVSERQFLHELRQGVAGEQLMPSISNSAIARS